MKNQTKNILFMGSLALLTMMYSCNPDDVAPEPEPIGNEPAITLTCDYFDENPNAILVDNPNAPVDYIVPEGCVMYISDDVTIQAGVTIEFQTKAGIRVGSDGSIKMIGTANKMITLTGEDKVPGSWIGIEISSSDVKNEIAYTTIEYGGFGNISASNYPGNVMVTGISGRLDFHNNIVQHSSSWGLNVVDGSTATNIRNNTFSYNESPLRLYIENANELDTNNTYEGNTSNMVDIVGGEMGGITLKKIDVPYYFVNYNHSSFQNYGAFKINPGVEIVMAEGMKIDIHSGSSFNAVGNAQELIKIRGLEAVKGYWNRIDILRESALTTFEYVDVRHGGSEEKGSINFNYIEGSVYIANSHFESIKGCALSHAYSNPGGIDLGPNVTYTDCEDLVCH